MINTDKKDNTDSRLTQVYEAIDNGLIEILSLDIFDTLLWRKLPSPEDLFLILGKKLKDEGYLIPAVTAENFTELRIVAERDLRMEKEFKQNSTEINLFEIYWKLQSLFVKISLDQMLAGNSKGIYESDVAELVGSEVALEKKFLQYDSNIAQLIYYANQKKIPVILVSDTYFEESQLIHFLDILHDKSMPLPIHKIYASCEYGLSKKEGLFNHVIEDLHTTPHKILHIGDNFKSDILAASKEGIKTLYFAKYNNKFLEVIKREWTENFYQRQQLLDPIQGDFGITALRTKIEHHISLSSIKEEDHFYWKYGAMVLGPVICGFINWIYERCYEMEQTQVFCLMREGKLYANLIKHFAPYYPRHVIDAKQLWISRVFIVHASIANASGKELIEAMNALLEEFTIEAFCNYLGLDICQMGKWSQFQHVVLEDHLLRKEFVLYLVTSEPLRNQIIYNASAKRQRFLKYLANFINFSDSGQMTLIDIGWKGTAQGALQRILQQVNAPIHLHGLYLGTTKETFPALIEGSIREGYLIKGGYPWGNAHLKGCHVLEQIATAETGLGSLQDIDDTGNVVTYPLAISSKQKNEASLVQQGIFAFFDLIGPYIKSGAIVWDSQSMALQNQLRAILERSMFNTTRAEAQKFGSWLHEHGPASNLIQTIGKNNYYEYFIKDMLPVAAFKDSNLNWPAAYAAQHSKYLTLTSQFLWFKTLPAQCFLSEDNFTLRIFLDKGHGFAKKASNHVDLRSNPNRNFYTFLKIQSTRQAIERIQLVLTFPSALVRIKSLRLLTYDKMTANPNQLTFFESETSHTIECLAEKQIEFNTFYCSKHLKLTHAFDSSNIYQVKVKLCCEMFKMDRY